MCAVVLATIALYLEKEKKVRYGLKHYIATNRSRLKRVEEKETI